MHAGDPVGIHLAQVELHLLGDRAGSTDQVVRVGSRVVDGEIGGAVFTGRYPAWPRHLRPGSRWSIRLFRSVKALLPVFRAVTVFQLFIRMRLAFLRSVTAAGQGGEERLGSQSYPV